MPKVVQDDRLSGSTHNETISSRNNGWMLINLGPWSILIYPVKNGHYCFWQVPKGLSHYHYQRQKHETDFLSLYSSTILKLQGCFLIASSMDWCAGIEGRVSPVPKSLVLSFSTQPSLPRAFIDHILSIVANHIQLN